MTYTDADLTTANHEGAHFVAAVLNGLLVDEVRIDRHASDMDGAGKIQTSFRDGDKRSPRERAAARVRIALAAVLVAPGKRGQADRDVTNAWEYARIARVEDPGAWIAAQSAEVTAMIRSKLFQEFLSNVSAILLIEPSITDPARIAAIIQQTPGALSASLSAAGLM